MNQQKNYIIPFVGLKNDIHHFDYEINGDFFASFPDSPLDDTDIRVGLQFDKRDNFFILIFDLEGTVAIECDRCYEKFNMEIGGGYQVIVKFDGNLHHHETEDEVEIIFIPSNETQINVSQYIYEFSILSIPIKRTHPLDENGKSTCNPEILTRLEDNVPQADANSDPRWEALKKIKTS